MEFLRWHSIILGILVLLVCDSAGARTKTQESDLIKAVRKDNFPVVKSLLDVGTDPNDKDANGNTALMIALENGYDDAARLLIAAKADSNIRSVTGATALTLASQEGSADIVKALLADKADVDLKAEHEGGVAMVLKLGKSNIPLIPILSGETALITAIRNNHPNIAQMLIKAKTDVNASTDDGITALMVALRGDYPDIVDELLAAGADVNAKTHSGFSVLMVAAHSGDLETVRALLANKVDANAKTDSGFSALMAASGSSLDSERLAGGTQNGNYATILPLPGLVAVAVVDSVLQKRFRDRSREIVRALLAAGVDANAKANNGFTA